VCHIAQTVAYFLIAGLIHAAIIGRTAIL